MVHEQLKRENPQLTFKQLRKLEQMDAQKSFVGKVLDVAKSFAETAGKTLVTMPVSLILANELIHLAEKGQSQAEAYSRGDRFNHWDLGEVVRVEAWISAAVAAEIAGTISTVLATKGAG